MDGRNTPERDDLLRSHPRTFLKTGGWLSSRSRKVCFSFSRVSKSLFPSFWFNGWFSAQTFFCVCVCFLWSAFLSISTHSSAPPAVLHCFYTRNIHLISGLLDTQMLPFKYSTGPRSLYYPRGANHFS